MSMIINPFVFGGAGGGGGSPSASVIHVTGNAEIEAAAADLFTNSGSLASGVTGAHGRVYDNGTFVVRSFYPSSPYTSEFISAGCRIYLRTNSNNDLFRIRYDPGGTNDHVKVTRSAGVFAVRLGLAGTIFSGSTSIAITTWYYAMLYARIHNTLGEFTAKLFDASGTLIETITRTGVDTFSGTNLPDCTLWGDGSADTYVDHLWTDLNGAFQGCGYVELLSPNAAGDQSDWTRGGTDTGANYAQVNEAPKNTTSYVRSTAADQVDLYNFANRSQAGTPITVQQVIYAHAHTAGTRQYKPICKIGGVIYEGTTQTVTSTSTSLAPFVYNWQNNPATGNAWADSEIDGAQFGVKSVTTDVRVQCVGLQILVSI